MSDVKIKVYTPTGLYVGYFLNPEIEIYPDSEYEISGKFFTDNGEPIVKMEFNPEALPYSADLSDMKDLPHSRMVNVYIQRGRQPVKVSGIGTNN